MDGDDSKDAGTGAMSVDTPGHAVMSVDTPKTASDVNMRKPLAPSKKTNTMSRIAETAMTVDSTQNLTPETRRLHSIFKDLYEAVMSAVQHYVADWDPEMYPPHRSVWRLRDSF